MPLSFHKLTAGLSFDAVLLKASLNEQQINKHVLSTAKSTPFSGNVKNMLQPLQKETSTHTTVHSYHHSFLNVLVMSHALRHVLNETGQYGEGKSVSYGDTLPHAVVGVCGEFQRTGRFLQRGI